MHTLNSVKDKFYPSEERQTEILEIITAAVEA